MKPADASITGVKWESTNEKVAVVDEYGVVTGVGRGQATIRATAADGGGQRASVNVTVKQQPESITLRQYPRGRRRDAEGDRAAEHDK